MARKIDAAILGKLIVIQQTLGMMPTPSGIASFLNRALLQVPGIKDSGICIDGTLYPPSPRFAETCAHCTAGGAPTGKCLGALGALPDVATFPLKAPNELVGVLHLTIADPEAFEPYRDFILNIANTVVLHLLTLRQSLELQKAHTLLEERVAERTRQLENANEALRQEIAAKEAAAAELEKSHAEIREILEHSPVPIAITDERGAVLYLNGSFTELFGYDIDDLPSLDRWWSLAYPDPEYRERIRAAWFYRIEEAARTGMPFEPLEGEITCRNGETRIVSFHYAPSGKRGLTLFHDITDRKRMERSLRESEERYRQLMEVSPDAALLVEGGIITLANSAAQKIFGAANAAEMVGQPLMKFVHPDSRQFAEQRMQDLTTMPQDTPQPFLEEKMVRLDGGVIHVETSSVSIMLNGRKAGLVVGRDISARKLAEEKLNALTAELLKSNHDLEQFAYVASHDLQEPLRTISSYLQLLQKRYTGKLDADADEFIGFAVGGARRMQGLINDLLTYSRIATRGVPPAVVDAEECLERALAGLRFLLEDTKTKIRRSPLPHVTADPAQLAQVFQNLIGNGVKFHRPDISPVIEIAAVESAHAWQFSVKDNGIGIEPRYFERIFQMFQRLHPLGAFPGSGMGLAIVKKIVERHGGTVSVESQPGEGSTFRFTLPKPPHSANP